MAQSVYTQRLWLLPSSTSTGNIQGPGPDTGFRWVVRDVRAVNTSATAGVLVRPLVLFGPQGAPIWSTPSYGTITGVLYRQELRGIVDFPDQLVAQAPTQNWNLVVDGYQLSLP